MIKLRLIGKYGDVIVLALQGENIERLRAGEPILFDGGEVGIDETVMITVAETTDELLKQLKIEPQMGD